MRQFVRPWAVALCLLIAVGFSGSMGPILASAQRGADGAVSVLERSWPNSSDAALAESVLDVAVSPDGSLLASVTDAGRLWVWRIRDRSLAWMARANEVPV